jgi:POT family proton-dependent oligopeptide transporter
MFKGHPKGLFVAFFANMGERFGFYTMYAIFVLYIQAKFGFDSDTSSIIWSIFLFGVYFLPLVGGILADRVLGYGRTITIGVVVLFVGYALLFVPGTKLPVIITALATIAAGTGLFKGNLQALVGNLYDDPQYSKRRDSAFSIFYMGINVGAFFAPHAANAMNRWILSKAGFTYNQEIPALAHQFLGGDLSVEPRLRELALTQVPTLTDLTQFCHSYIDQLSESYNFGFGVAAISMVVSFLIFILFRRYYKHADVTASQKVKPADSKVQVAELTHSQTRQRIFALVMVFIVVIFFWMSFHQNGLSITWFARDYTQSLIGPWIYVFFDIKSVLCISAAIIGIVLLFTKGKSANKIIGAILVIAGLGLAYYFQTTFGPDNKILPQDFQQFNPLYIVIFTPVVLAVFAALARRGKEPSAPRKIAIGMLITAIAFLILMVASLGLESPKNLSGQGGISDALVSPFWLVGMYFVLTIAELFLSPMGISFVSKVAPPKYKGFMQGGWFAATSVGNLLVGVMGLFWKIIPLWAFWLILASCCMLSFLFIISILKRLEKASQA